MAGHSGLHIKSILINPSQQPGLFKYAAACQAQTCCVREKTPTASDAPTATHQVRMCLCVCVCACVCVRADMTHNVRETNSLWAQEVCVHTCRSQIASGNYMSTALRWWRGIGGETERKKEVEEDDKRRSSNLSLHTYSSPGTLCLFSPSIPLLAATWRYVFVLAWTTTLPLCIYDSEARCHMFAAPDALDPRE